MASDENEKDSGDGGSKAAFIIKVFGALLIIIMVLAYVTPPQTQEYNIHGIRVISEIPLEDLKSHRSLTMSKDSASPEEVTCKFGLSAISTPSPGGYRIHIEEGEKGIYLGREEARIKGSNEKEVLSACHAFACIWGEMDCPDDFLIVHEMFEKAGSVSVIIGDDVGPAAGRGYVEVIGALSYLQTIRADINRDGRIEQIEADLNEFFIYPFLMTDAGCLGQPLHNVLQNWSGTDEAVDCEKIAPAIVIRGGDDDSMRLDGSRLILSGKDQSLHAMAIISRDIICPKWIRRMHGLE